MPTKALPRPAIPHSKHTGIRMTHATRTGLLVLMVSVACSSASSPASTSAGIGSLTTTFQECISAGGEVEPPERGGRCFSYYTPRADASAYAHCRDAGGVSGVRGPGRSRHAAGQSHVCTLVFEPGP